MQGSVSHSSRSIALGCGSERGPCVRRVGGVADIRLDNLTPLPKPRPGGKLVTTGVYSYLRHPMYAGLLAFAFGLAAFTGDEARAAMAAALTVILSLKVRVFKMLLWPFHRHLSACS